MADKGDSPPIVSFLGIDIEKIKEGLGNLSGLLQSFEQQFGKTKIDLSVDPKAAESLNKLFEQFSNLFGNIRIGAEQAKKDLADIADAGKKAGEQKTAPPPPPSTSGFNTGKFLEEIDAFSQKITAQFTTLNQLAEGLKGQFPQISSLASDTLSKLSSIGAATAGNSKEALKQVTSFLQDLNDKQGAFSKKLTELKVALSELSKEKDAIDNKKSQSPEEQARAKELAKQIAELTEQYRQLALAKEVNARAITTVQREQTAIKPQAAQQTVDEKQTLAEQARIEKGVQTLVQESSNIKREIVREEIAEEERARQQAAAEEERRIQGLNTLFQEASKLRREAAQEEAQAQAEAAQFRNDQPTRVADANRQLVESEKLVAQAKAASTVAQDNLTAARKRGDPTLIAQAEKGLTDAEKAEAAATEAQAKAKEHLNQVSDTKSTREQVTQTGNAAKASRDAASTAVAHSNAQNRLTRTIQESITPTSNQHDVLLGLLAVSRFLPGELGRVVSGFGLLAGASRSTTGLIIGVTGAIASLILEAGRMGFEFNKSLIQIVRTAEGLGTTVEQARALDFVFEQFGEDAEIGRQGFRKIQEAISGSGTEAVRAKNSLEALLGRRITISDTPVGIFKELAKTIDELNKSEVSAGLLQELFGRSVVTVVAALKQYSKQADEATTAVRKSGAFTKEATDKALEQQKAVANLGLAWDALRAKLATPVTALIKLTVKLTELPGVGRLFGPPHPELEGLTNEDVKNIDQILSKEFTNEQRLTEAFQKRQEQLRAAARNGQLLQESTGQAQFERALKEAKPFKGPIRPEVFTPENESEAVAQDQLTQEANKLKAIQAQRGLVSKEDEERDKLIADKEAELDKITKSITAEKDGIEKLRQQITFLQQTGEDQEKVNARQKLLNEDLANLSVFVRQENTLRKEIAELKRNTPLARKQEEREGIREELSTLEADSDKFKEVAKKLFQADKELIGLSKTPQDRTRFGRQLAQDIRQVNRQVFEQQKRDFEDFFNKLKTDAQNTIIDLEAEEKRAIQTSNVALAAGLVSVRQAAEQQIAAIERIQSVSDTLIKSRIVERNKNIAQLQERIKDATKTGEDPTILQKEVARLNKENRADEVTQNQERAKSFIEERNVAIKAQEDIISNRQELFKIEIGIQEEVNRRKLELLARAARESVLIEEEEIRERAKLEREQNQRSLDALVTLLAQRKALFEASKESENQASVKPLTELTLPGGVNNVSTQRLSRIIQEIQARPLTEQSKELLDILNQILLIKQKGLDIDQREGIELQDNLIRKTQVLLDIKRQELDLSEAILSIQQNRLQFLEQEGLLLKPEAREREIDFERQKLRLIQQRISELEKERDITVAQKTQIIGGGKPISQEQVTIIEASPEVTNLNNQLVKLKGEARASADRLAITASVLGRIRTALDDVIDAANAAPDAFGKFKAIADIAKGAKELVNAILGLKLGKVKTPAEEIKEATEDHNKKVKDAADNFKKIIEDAAKEFKDIVSGITIPGGGAGTSSTNPFNVAGGALDALQEAGGGSGTGHSLGGGLATGAAKSNLSKTIGSVIDKAGTVVSGLIQGFSAQTLGGKIAGFGKIASIIPVAGPFIAAGAQIVGGIVDLFEAAAKKRAEEKAAQINANVDAIIKAFKRGSTGLGQTVSELEGELRSARVQLNAMGKFGKEQLKQIEIAVGQQLEQLREQIKQVQDKFKTALDQLRLPVEFRSPVAELRDALAQVKEFLQSFENAADAVSHFGEAQEFLALSFKDIQANVQDAADQAAQRVKDLQDQAIQNLQDFEAQREAIINQGRVRTEFDEAKDRLIQLFQLEEKRLQDQRRTADEIKKAQADAQKQKDLLTFLQNLFDKLEKRLNKFIDRLERTGEIEKGFPQTLEALLTASQEAKGLIPQSDKQFFERLRNDLLNRRDPNEIIAELQRVISTPGIDADTKNFAQQILALLQKELASFGQASANAGDQVTESASQSTSSLDGLTTASNKTTASFDTLSSKIDSFVASLKNAQTGTFNVTRANEVNPAVTTQNVNISVSGGFDVNISGATQEVTSRITDSLRTSLRSINPLSDLIPRRRPLVP